MLILIVVLVVWFIMRPHKATIRGDLRSDIKSFVSGLSDVESDVESEFGYDSDSSSGSDDEDGWPEDEMWAYIEGAITLGVSKDTAMCMFKHISASMSHNEYKAGASAASKQTTSPGSLTRSEGAVYMKFLRVTTTSNEACNQNSSIYVNTPVYTPNTRNYYPQSLWPRFGYGGGRRWGRRWGRRYGGGHLGGRGGNRGMYGGGGHSGGMRGGS
jgi:hypothetical protein